MRVVKNPDERKQEILSGAIRVFSKKGYEKTSITDIAKEIGVSQGLCYRYFPSKEAIYNAAIDEYAQYIVTNNLKITNFKGKTLKEQILEMSGKMNDYSNVEKNQTDLYELFHKPENKKLHDELFHKVGEKLIPIIKKILDDAKNRGEINISDTDTVAYFFIYGQIGMLMRKDISEDEKTQRIQNSLLELLGL